MTTAKKANRKPFRMEVPRKANEITIKCLGSRDPCTSTSYSSLLYVYLLQPILLTTSYTSHATHPSSSLSYITIFSLLNHTTIILLLYHIPTCTLLHVHRCTTSLPHCYPTPALCQSIKTKPPLLLLHCKGIKCEGKTTGESDGRSRSAAHEYSLKTHLVVDL